VFLMLRNAILRMTGNGHSSADATAAPSSVMSCRCAVFDDGSVAERMMWSAMLTILASGVEKMKVVSISRLIFFIRSMICSPVAESRFAVGSSARTMEGLVTRARPNGDPLALAAGQLVGLVIAPVAQPYLADEKIDPFLPFAFGESGLAEQQGNSMFSHTFRTGMRFERLEYEARTSWRKRVSSWSDRPFCVFYRR